MAGGETGQARRHRLTAGRLGSLPANGARFTVMVYAAPARLPAEHEHTRCRKNHGRAPLGAAFERPFTRAKAGLDASKAKRLLMPPNPAITSKAAAGSR
jgi:hypothetical protein